MLEAVLVALEFALPDGAPQDGDGSASGIEGEHQGLVQVVVQIGPVLRRGRRSASWPSAKPADPHRRRRR